MDGTASLRLPNLRFKDFKIRRRKDIEAISVAKVGQVRCEYRVLALCRLEEKTGRPKNPAHSD
jgi:hypothetical protein